DQQFVVFVNNVEFNFQLSTATRDRVSLPRMKEKWNLWLPVLLMLVFACTRWPALWPESLSNFSAAYALAFCAGVYFPRRLAWWLPLGTLLVTDILLNLFYYHTSALTIFMTVNYLAYAG